MELEPRHLKAISLEEKLEGQPGVKLQTDSERAIKSTRMISRSDHKKNITTTTQLYGHNSLKIIF